MTHGPIDHQWTTSTIKPDGSLVVVWPAAQCGHCLRVESDCRGSIEGFRRAYFRCGACRGLTAIRVPSNKGAQS